jgi:acetyltransferase-like isoleucine patch superfamily enzyme
MMELPPECTPVVVPREGVNDDVVRVVQWLVADGEKVEGGKPLVVLETMKASFELEAPAAGYVFRIAEAGAEVPVGALAAVLAPRPERPRVDLARPAAKAVAGEQVVTNKAQALIRQHGLESSLFAGLPVVRAADVEALLGRQAAGREAPPAPMFRGEPLDAGADWDAQADTALHRELSELLTRLRKRMKARFNRHVSTGDLLSDRWDLAKDFGFGEGTSVYDDCLILGGVKVGRHCWIGPGTILDGMHGQLTIGDYVDVGAGAHLYTHNTIERALTGHRAPLFKKATTVGNCCFIAPKAVLAPGTVLGDHCFVAAGSYVEGVFPAFSFIAGNTAKRVGSVEVRGDRARVRPLSEPRHQESNPDEPG